MLRRLVFMGFLLPVMVVLLSIPSRESRGVVSQIDGTIVPTTGALQIELTSHEGDPVVDPLALDAIVDAETFPQIYLPPDYGSGQVVTFTDIQEMAGFENTFGWYNVGDTSRLFKIFECTDEPDLAVIVDFDVEADNFRWDGGFIAFYLITPEDNPSPTNCGDFFPANLFGHIYYTESELNGDGDYVHNLVYSSKKDPNRFYFAFEDLFRGGDNDFTDMTIKIEGLTPPCVPEAEVCDGVDNDCDGDVDEDPVDAGGQCGTDVGTCEFGAFQCVGGALQCQGGVGVAPEVCDGLDNDCDGTDDNNLTDEGQVCGTNDGECDTGLTVCVSSTLQCQGEIGPVTEECDGLDNDCDLLTDENLGQTTCGLGICVNTIDNCIGGVPQTCDPFLNQLTETCNGADDDCDGIVDGLVRDCYTLGTGCALVMGSWVCQGICTTGLEECPVGGAGTWGACLNQQGSAAEVCDGLDNDCDGFTDENLTLTCYPMGYGPSTGCISSGNCVGSCSEGSRDCVVGSYGACNSASTPAAEVCDGQDNDCDGQTDEGLTQGCQNTNTEGTCTGVEICSSGSWQTCTAATPAAEICNNIDDDCDGAVDEGVTDVCYTGAVGTEGQGLCHGGTLTCTAGTWSTTCSGEVVPTAEVCDGLDNDCDGVADEGPGGAPMTQACYSGPASTENVGVCTGGTRTCTGGAWSPCVGEVVPSSEQCNGLDDDCDDDIDEGLGQATCGLGVCQQTVDNCVGGSPQTCDPYQGATVEECDGVDNDCDGVIDGLAQNCYEFGAGCTETTPGVFTCQGTCASGLQICPVGGVGNWGECLYDVGPGTEVCDGLDNDCDGDVDEDANGAPLSQDCYPPGSGTSTGCTYDTGTLTWTCLGVCTAGDRECTGAAWGTCSGHVTPTVEVCDGSDNDCDGDIDEEEDIPGLNQPCGTALGRCTPGVLRCIDSSEICEGGDGPFPGVCNGEDDDCDGEIDEPDEVDAEEGQPCGDATGVCEPGLTQCVGGGIVCDGGVQPTEEVCDGLDNDCDGVPDDAAECPPDFWCVQADCRPECDPSSEFPCPGTQVCVEVDVGGGQLDHVCLPDTGGDCGGVTCPDGWICDNEVCVDPCDPNPCEGWQDCVTGACVDNSCTGLGQSCPAGEFCINHDCVADPCDTDDCDTNEYCVRECDAVGCTHRCEPLCDCRGDETCDVNGNCVPDPCFGVECALGQVCDLASGGCIDDVCAAVYCSMGEACFEGECLPDPCDLVECPPFFECEVRSGTDGQGDATAVPLCTGDDTYWGPGGNYVQLLATGDGGCQCQGGSGPAGLPEVLLLFALGLWWRRRRVGAAGGDQEVVP
jgi:Notch 1